MLKNLDFKTDVLPFIIATGGEFAALYFWLHFIGQNQFILGNIILWAGFLTERISVITWIRYVYRPKEGVAAAKVPLLQTAIGIILITLSEIIIWIAWLLIVDGGNDMLGEPLGHILGAVILMVLMQGEHSMEMALLKKQKITQYLLNGRTIFFTFMEVAGAVGWLYFVREGNPMLGALFLLVGLSIEHVLQGSQLKPDDAAAS